MRERRPDQHRNIGQRERAKGVTTESRTVIVDGKKRHHCRMCGALNPVGRPSFCSGEAAAFGRGVIVKPGSGCVHEWLIRSDTRYMRAHVLQRDRAICVGCGTDCAALRSAVHALRAWPEVQVGAVVALGYTPFDASCVHPMWQADHTLPVCQGGGSCGLEGIRTLCLPCHRAATADLHRTRRASPEQRSLFG